MKLKSTRKPFSLIIVVACLCISAGSFARSSSVTTYVTKPISGTMILPDTDPSALPGVMSDKITIVAAPGEYEPASFVVRPDADIASLTARSSDLKNGKRIIPASAIDIKLVKCWYQSKGAWKTINRLGYSKVLIPELLLNDDTLIRVAADERENYIKLKYADGSSNYVCISKKPDVELEDIVPQNPAIYAIAPGIDEHTPIEQFPVSDSPKLLPVGVKAGNNQQFWVTVHVPSNAKAGVYTGKIKLFSSGQLIKTMTVELRVLPFQLASARTYYDSGKKFTSSIYYRGELDATGKGSTTADTKNEKQFLAEMKNLLVHGVTQPSICLPYSKIADNEKLFRDILRLRREAGITGPYYLLFDLVINQQDQAALEEMQKNITRLMSITKEYGISEFYFYGIDETSGDLLLSQKAAWKATHEVGGKVMVSGYAGTFEAMGELLDLLIWNGPVSRDEARKWHSIGHEIWSYANPQAGIENPERYRRGYGIALWKEEYDGAATYCYQTGTGGWNDFNDICRDLSFTYPTVNGVVDTLAWEAYREGIDDIRYASTLKLAVEKAKKSSDSRKKQLAAEADEFLIKLDGSGDMDSTRSEIIRHILALS